MTRNAQALLEAFDSLDPAEKQKVAAEILRRSLATGDLPEQSLLELASDVFQAYDAEESDGANS